MSIDLDSFLSVNFTPMGLPPPTHPSLGFRLLLLLNYLDIRSDNSFSLAVDVGRYRNPTSSIVFTISTSQDIYRRVRIMALELWHSSGRLCRSEIGLVRWLDDLIFCRVDGFAA